MKAGTTEPQAGAASKTTSLRAGPLRPLLGLSAAAATYAVLGWVPGRFAAIDEVFYKAAGRNWAATGHFAAPEVINYLAQGPPLSTVFFAFPPVYPFLFGVYTKVFGFQPRTCIGYDLIIHLALVFLLAGVARRVLGAGWPVAALCGALALPLGTLGRPDELGFVFALAAAIGLQSRRPVRAVWLGGIWLGLCAATSPGAACFVAPLGVVEWLRRRRPSRPGLRLVQMGVAASVTVTACVAPILMAHPEAYRQFTSHAGLQSAYAISRLASGAGTLLGAARFAVWNDARYAFSNFWLALVLCGLVLLFHLGRRSGRRAIPALLWPLALLVLLVVSMPLKDLYLWFPLGWMLAAVVVEGEQRLRDSAVRYRKMWLGLAAAAWLIACAPYLRTEAILWTLPRAQSLDATTARLRAEIPAGASVMTTDYWWALGDRNQVFDQNFGRPDHVDYVILDGNGSGVPGRPVDLFWPRYRVGLVPLDDQLNRKVLDWGGFRLENSAYGFGALVLGPAPGAGRASP